MSESKVCVLQVTNISPGASKEQVYSLFSYIGSIQEYRVYPSSENTQIEKFAFIKFKDENCVELGQHLTNTVFIDRAIVCIPAQTNRIPDEETALRTGPTLPGQRSLPPSVTNSIQNVGDGQELLFTNDPNLTALGLPAYPPLPANTDPAKVEEIRRTVYVGNLDKNCDGDNLMAFLNACIGEVMYLRMTQENEAMPCAYAYVEFSKQATIPLALQNNGIEYNERALRIQHSRVAIIKPKQKTADQALEEVEDAIRLHEGREAASASRAYSPSERRSGSRRRSPSPRRRSTERSARRSRDRSPRRSRDRSPRRDRDRRSSRSPRRRRSRSREDRDRDSRRDRDRDRSDRDRVDRDKDRSDRDRDRDRDSRRDREKVRERSPEERKKKKDKDRGERKEKDRKRSRSKSPKKSKKKTRSRSPSPKKSKKDKDRKKSPPRTPSPNQLEEEAELRRRLLEKASLHK